MHSAFVAALLLVAGCATGFEPTVAMRGRSRDVDVQLLEVRASAASARFLYRTRSIVSHQLGKAWLTVADRAPCSGGAEATNLELDGLETSTLVAGTHALAATFDSRNSLRFDLVVDVELDGPGCLRAPAISQSLPMVPPRRFLLVADLSINFTGLPDLRAVDTVGLGGAGWVGPLLLSAEAAIGAGTCNSGACGRDSGGQLRESLAFSAGADARYLLDAFSLNRIGWLFTGGLRYRVSSARLSAPATRHMATVHSAQAVLALGMADRAPGPFAHLERTPLLETAVFVGPTVDPESRRVATSGGIEIRVLLPL
jgi:hypothetical protein